MFVVIRTKSDANRYTIKLGSWKKGLLFSPYTAMSETILHHYDMSPYAEKVRLGLGLRGIVWRSMQIPIVMPKPDLTEPTGGYRRAPMFQLGAPSSTATPRPSCARSSGRTRTPTCSLRATRRRFGVSPAELKQPS